MADYTRLAAAEIKNLLAWYDLGECTAATPLEGGQANSSIKIETDKGKFILCVCDEKTIQEVDCLTKVLACLEEKSFPTSRLVQARNRALFIMLGKKPVYVKKFLPGEIVENLSCNMIFQVGRAMADLHALPVIKEMADLFPYGIHAFDQVLESGFDHPYIPWLKQKKAFLEQAIDPSMDKGFVHGDIFWDNLLFNKDRLAAVLDFEEACNYYRLYDLGMCMVGCCAKEGRFDLEMVRHLVLGYGKNHPFTKKEKSQLRVFMEYAATAASFWRFRQYNIRFLGHGKRDTYKELSALADHVHAMEETEFKAIFSNL